MVASPTPLDLLLARMRDGDRHAAAEFMTRYGPRIRRRARPQLSQPIRRVYDSQDILSTVGRRLDNFVRHKRVAANTVDELWGLVNRMASNAVVDKARIVRRAAEIHAEDPAFGDRVFRTTTASRDSQVDWDLILDIPKDETARTILRRRLEGVTHETIAKQVDLSADAVRQRWRGIREEVVDYLEGIER